jgi:hypothetical protein
MKLRIELERVKETAAKDRKLSSLRIADLEEQLADLRSSQNAQQDLLERKLSEAERERDGETAKVRQLQEALKQLTSGSRSASGGAIGAVAGAKENHGNSSTSNNAKDNSKPADKSECLQQ